MPKRNWDNAYNYVLDWAKAEPRQAATLTLSNHNLGPRKYELRICVRDSQGRVLAAAHGARGTRYLPGYVENFIMENLSKVFSLSPAACRLLGEPVGLGATYPLLPGDPESCCTDAETYSVVQLAEVAEPANA